MMVLLAALLLAVTYPSGAALAKKSAAIVIDTDTGTILHQDNPDERSYPASLTKMMTLYLTFEALRDGRLRLDRELPVSAHAANQAPSKLGVQPGDTLRVEDAILGLTTKSANDAAVVLAEAIGGSEPAFAARMTEKARDLGMSRTLFRNASGLPNGEQMSTVRDMSTLARHLISDWPQYYPYFRRASFTYNGVRHRNHNHLMARYPGMDGIKTGFIQASGFNLAASAVRNGHRLVAVVFGGDSARLRDNYMAQLLDDGFRRVGAGGRPETRQASGGSIGDVVASLPAENGEDAGDADDSDSAEQTPPQPPVQRVAMVAPVVKQLAKNPPRAPEKPASNWGIFLGNFRDRGDAKAAYDKAVRLVPAGSGRPALHLEKVAKRRGHPASYRLVLVGLDSRKDARMTCAKVRRVTKECEPIAPGQL